MRKRTTPVAQYARSAAADAIKRGILVRPSTCEECRARPRRKIRAPISAHHPDYAKPLEVVWLCRSCHNKKHPRRKGIPRWHPESIGTIARKHGISRQRVHQIIVRCGWKGMMLDMKRRIRQANGGPR